MCGVGNPIEKRGQFPGRAEGSCVFESFSTGEHQDNDEARPVLTDEKCGDDGGHRKDIQAPFFVEQRLDHVDALVSSHDCGKTSHDPTGEFFSPEGLNQDPSTPHQRCRQDPGVASKKPQDFSHHWDSVT